MATITINESILNGAYYGPYPDQYFDIEVLFLGKKGNTLFFEHLNGKIEITTTNPDIGFHPGDSLKICIRGKSIFLEYL